MIDAAERLRHLGGLDSYSARICSRLLDAGLQLSNVARPVALGQNVEQPR